MTDAEIRASDTERDAIARRLRDECAAGRLSIDELDERLESVYAAVTRSQLDRLVSDLPGENRHASPAQRRYRFFWPGIAPFGEQRHLVTPCADSFAAAQREMVPRMGTQGFHLDDEIWPRRLRFVSDTGCSSRSCSILRPTEARRYPPSDTAREPSERPSPH